MVKIIYFFLCVGIVLVLLVVKWDNVLVFIFGKYIIIFRLGVVFFLEIYLFWVRDVYIWSFLCCDEFGIEKVYFVFDFYGYVGFFDEEIIV